MSACVCGEINTRHCPIHQEVDLKAGFEDSYWIAASEEWAPAPSSERRFRVTRFHKGDDGNFKEAVVPLRSLKSQLENFCKGDDLYGIWVDPL